MLRGIVATAAALVLAVGFTTYGAMLHRNHVFPYRQVHALFGSEAEAGTGINPWLSPSYRMRRAMFEAFPSKGDVLLLGDSLTEVLDERAAFPNLSIVNQGISADTTVGVLDRLKIAKATGAHTIAIMLGVNDLNEGQTADATAGRYADIVKALAPGRCVIVQSTLFAARGPELNAAIARLNDRLKAMCADGRLCRFLNLNARIAPDGVLPASMTVDGIHLLGPAYHLWRDALRPAIDACVTSANSAQHRG